jgi:hypothetical protein
VDGPCDITDLMRLAEAELARRLRLAAETMDGVELVAHLPGRDCDACERCGAHCLHGTLEDGLCALCSAHKRWWG